MSEPFRLHLPVRVILAGPADVAGWHRAAGDLLRQMVAPQDVIWSDDDAADDLFAAGDGTVERPVRRNETHVADSVGADLTELAGRVLLHKAADRFALMYRLAWRMRDTPDLLRNPADADVARALQLAKSVRRDMHKMTAFVRFRAVRDSDGSESFIAWFEPEHHILAATAPFFVRRFANMRWAILTPEGSAFWDGEGLKLGPGARRADAGAEDRFEDLWRTYFASIFNPARLKIKAMTAEMPKKYWRNLPEASLIQPLIRSAGARAAAMVDEGAQPTRRRVPESARPARRDVEISLGHAVRALSAGEPPSRWTMQSEASCETLDAIAKAVGLCRRCPLHCDATQAVPGMGTETARIMFVGEQPGDREDLEGRPFVGPAGRIFDAALERAGIARADIYVTNAVKHFKFVARGKRRLHQRPNTSEIDTCRWWLDQERRLVRPRLIVAMGATALRGILGKTVAFADFRGRTTTLDDGTRLVATVHPAFILRQPDREASIREWHAYLADIRRIPALLV
jgi:DNA polymerase